MRPEGGHRLARPAAVLVSVSQATDAWHIAYEGGLSTLCGRVLVEGEYNVAGPDEYEYPDLLHVCRFCRKRELVT